MTLGRLRWGLGLAALALYLWMTVLFYGIVIPSTRGLLPPDFRFLGYDLWEVVRFSSRLDAPARDAYGMVNNSIDPLFATAFAAWMVAMAWGSGTSPRAGRLAIAVLALAGAYLAAELAEDKALHAIACLMIIQPGDVAWAAAMTQAKFASAAAALGALTLLRLGTAPPQAPR